MILLLFTIFILVLTLAILFNVNYDYDKQIGFWGHTVRWILRAVFSSLLAYVLNSGELFKTVTWSLFASAYWWSLFDLLYNLKRKLDPLYVGQTATTDRVFKNVPWFQFFVKIFLLMYALCWVFQPEAFPIYDSVRYFCDNLEFHLQMFLRK